MQQHVPRMSSSSPPPSPPSSLPPSPPSSPPPSPPSSPPPSPTPTVVRIVHFNDVYNIQHGATEPVGGASRFVAAVQRQLTCAAVDHSLVLFSGDAFSPAPLTRLTAGAEIPPVLNACRVDVACIGNHELDNGLDVMKQRIAETSFPWILSNVWQKTCPDGQDANQPQPRRPLAGMPSFLTLTRGAVKFGFIGLASWDWLCAVHHHLLSTLQYVPFVDAAAEMADMLRREHGCHFVIALTHMRNPDDFLLADAAVVDLILGGHDHVLLKELVGSTWVLKSGTDFKSFSTLDLYITTDHKVHVSEPQHHYITSDMPEHPEIAQFVTEKIALLGPRWTKNVALSSSDLDGRFVSIRTRETALGNFICDAMTNVMDADIGLVNSGSFRSDSIHPAGAVTLGMIDTILPYKDQVVVAEYSGAELMQRLECSVSQYPHLVGSFCQVSGITFSFDPRRERGSRILRDTMTCRNSERRMAPINDDERYRCALKTWIFYGNDGFPRSEDSQIVSRADCPLPQLITKYIEEVKTVGDKDMPQVSPQVEHRIRCVCPDDKLLQAYRHF